MLNSGFKFSEIVSGGAKGVDRVGESIAALGDIDLKIFPADWDLHGKGAGHIRNRQMAEYADALVAVWDGESRGTKNMIDTMKRMGKPVFVVIMNKIN
jgi:predicted Rossmann fold nucleotide-binding protein DprA/Smf involved in DNA uptake